ncbi:MAG: hypothetical protein ACKVP7_14585 [Hyphomicrobiaceae bacterium]
MSTTKAAVVEATCQIADFEDAPRYWLQWAAILRAIAFISLAAFWAMLVRSLATTFRSNTAELVELVIDSAGPHGSGLVQAIPGSRFLLTCSRQIEDGNSSRLHSIWGRCGFVASTRAKYRRIV